MSWIDELRRLLRGVEGTTPEGMPPGPVSCEEATGALFDWLDGELAPEVEEKIGMHLEACAHCYPRLVFERSFLEAVSRAAAASEIPPGLRAEVLHFLEAEGLSA